MLIVPASTPAEVEQVLENDPLDLEPQQVNNEQRFPSIGITNGGRWLAVITIVRGPRVRVVTAFDASKRAIDLYLTERGS